MPSVNDSADPLAPQGTAMSPVKKAGDPAAQMDHMQVAQQMREEAAYYLKKNDMAMARTLMVLAEMHEKYASGNITEEDVRMIEAVARGTANPPVRASSNMKVFRSRKQEIWNIIIGFCIGFTAASVVSKLLGW